MLAISVSVSIVMFMEAWQGITMVLMLGGLAGALGAGYLIAQRFTDLHGAFGQPLTRPMLRFAGQLERFAAALQRRFTPPAKRCFDLAHGHLVSRLMQAAVQHGIPDAFGQEPRSAAAVAEELKLDEASVRRLLRVLVAHGCFAAVDGTEQMYRHNAVSVLLKRDHPVSLRPWMLMLDGSFSNWKRFDGLKPKGADEWKREVGTSSPKTPWPVMLKNAELCRNRIDDAAVSEDVDWSRFKRVIDFGGDHGQFLALLLRSNPKLTGLLCEPSVRLERSQQVWSRRHVLLGERVEFIDTPTLRATPATEPGDAIVVRHQLAGLDEDEVMKVITNIRANLRSAEVTLFIVGVIPQEQSESSTNLVFELQAVSEPQNSVRFETDWRALLAACGFKVRSRADVRGFCSVLEAEPSSRKANQTKAGKPSSSLSTAASG